MENLPRHEITTVADKEPQYLIFGYLVFICDLHTDETHGWNAYRQCFANKDEAIAYAKDQVQSEDYVTPIAQVVELLTGRVEEFNHD